MDYINAKGGSRDKGDKTMNGTTVYTNKDEGLKRIAEDHFAALEDVNLMSKHGVIDHDSKYEWKFDNVYEAIMACNYLANHFEFCRRF